MFKKQLDLSAYQDEKGAYLCRACGEKLFEHSAKFDPGSGASFRRPKNAIR